MEAEEKRRREVEIGEEAAKRLQHLEIANSGGNVEVTTAAIEIAIAFWLNYSFVLSILPIDTPTT